MKMNVPNKLTIVRIILTPIFLALFLAPIPHHYLIGLVVFAILIPTLEPKFTGFTITGY